MCFSASDAKTKHSRAIEKELKAKNKMVSLFSFLRLIPLATTQNTAPRYWKFRQGMFLRFVFI